MCGRKEKLDEVEDGDESKKRRAGVLRRKTRSLRKT